MSLKFEPLDPLIKGDFGLQNDHNEDNNNDLDILDEFLDKRLYEDQIQAQPNQQLLPQHLQQHNLQQQQQQQVLLKQDVVPLQSTTDQEMFNNFLTDEINKNDFILFSPNATDANVNNIDLDFNQNIGDVLNQTMPSLTATTPMSIDGNSPGSKSDVFHTPNSINATTDTTYENARNILSNLKFGTEAPTQYSNEFPKEYIDIDADSLPYKLSLHNLPTYSRVETQIKLDFTVSPPPPQFLIQLPNDTIAKQKFCLSSPLTDDIKQNVLSLETFVMTATTMKPCNTCSRCVRREQKRASRRKSGVSDNLNWATNTNKRAIIFNCKEIISFPPTSTTDNSKNIDISARIVCYCRHHSENKGFKLLFILKNASNEIVAKHLSTPIMIMDRKKTGEDGSIPSSIINSDTNMGNTTATPSTAPLMKSQPLSPTSIEEDSSEPHTTDSRVFKRKKTWSPELSDGFSITPQRKVSSALNLTNSINMQPTRSINEMTPIIQRIIPAQGPLRGGIEVTLLGTNFKQGLNVTFGMNKALSTQCWSDSTMVTYLPPASQPGQVIVTVEDPEQPNEGENKGSSIFTYLDDTDRQMIELALQIVGLKMNGKLEDARNIARKIIGSESSNDGSMNGNAPTFNTNPMDHFALNVNDEDLILKVIAMLPANPNLSICTPEAQTLLHLSCLKGYYKLVSSLLTKGARVDVRDINGYTPLHFACIAGNRTCIELLLNCKANTFIRNNNGETAEDVANINVLDLFKFGDLESINMSRKFSNSSISSSIFSVEEFSSGMHVSRMTTDRLSGTENEDDYSDDDEDDASDEESEYDLEEEDSFIESPIVGSSSTFIQPTDIGSSDEADLTRPTEKSIWRKVRNVFNDELPRYDDLFPNKTWKIASFTNTNTSTETNADPTVSETSDTEDIFQKFFHQRKNIQNDKMLLFVWLPLLILIIGSFIMINAGWKFEFKDHVQEFIRKSLGTIMLGNERFKVVLNKHLSQVNDAVTSVINVS